VYYDAILGGLMSSATEPYAERIFGHARLRVEVVFIEADDEFFGLETKAIVK
jgi:hypothetical protein